MTSGHNAPTLPLVRAHWFDGLSSRPHNVLVGLEPSTKGGPSLLIHELQSTEQAPRRYANKDVTWPEAWSAKRHQERLIVDLNDGGNLEITDPAQWQKALEQSGFQPSLAQRMQTRWPLFLGVFAAAAIGLVLFYKFGTPWAAAQLTRHVPLSWETALSHEAMEQLDDHMLKPSKLPEERQEQLRREFEALLAKTPPFLQRYHGYAPQYTLQFRRGMGANAFALPGGTIVVTDGLIETAQRHKIGDDAIIGVLAHEIGHVAHRHTTRMVVEQGVLNTGLGLALGDVSSIVATGSTLLTGLAYQRSHESEADCFAIAVLANSNIPTAPMGDLLLAMAKERDKYKSTDDEDDKAPTASQPASSTITPPEKSEELQESGALISMLSTHPDTVARARALRDGTMTHCPRQP